MNRQSISLYALAATAALICAGCGGRTATAPLQTASVPPPVVAPAPNPAPAAFEPYKLIPQTAPKPQVVVKKKCVLRVVRRNKTVYLTDQSGRSFLAGRDQKGHLYPVYQSPETHQDYPVYYDQNRDRYYREAQADGGRYYRNYVGDPNDQYYQSDSSQPYPDYQPEIVNSDGSIYDNGGYGGNGGGYASNGNYDNGGGYDNNGGYHDGSVPEHHRNNHRDDWLWAIPVIVGAYFLLNQHHHNSSPNYQNYQSPGIAAQYPGSGANAPGAYPPYVGNNGVRQPFPSATNSGQANPSPIGTRQPFPSGIGSRRPVFGAAAGRQAVLPGTPGRQTFPGASGQSRVPGLRPAAPPTGVRPVAAVRLPAHAARPFPRSATRRQTSIAPTRRFPSPTARPVVRVLPPVAGRPFPIHSARISPATRSAVPARRFPSPARRPVTAVRRLASPAPRAVIHHATAVRSRPGFSAARRPSLPYGSTIKRAAPAPQRRTAFPSAPRLQTHRVPEPVRAAPAARMRSAPVNRPVPAPARQIAPPARRPAPTPRAAPAPAPARTAPASTKPR